MFDDRDPPTAGDEVEGVALPAPAVSPCAVDDSSFDDEVASLAGDLHAASARLVALVDRADVEGRWDGFASPAQWLSWRTGLSPAEARRHVEVAIALRALPQVAAAFATGRLSFAKVHAIAPVATDTTETMLLGWSLAASTAQVIKVANTIRRVERLRDEDPLAGRYLHWWFDDAGMMVVSGRLPAHVGRLVAKAIDALLEHVPDIARAELETTTDTDTGASTDGFDAEVGPVELAELEAEAPGEPLDVRRADALGLMADAALAWIGSERSDEGARFQVMVHTTQAVLDGGDPAGEICEFDDGSPAHPDIVRRIACDADLVTMTGRAAS